MNDRPDDTSKKKDDKSNSSENPNKSTSDPQLTELDSIKKGGKEPTVNPSDPARDGHGKKD